jgi:predicted nucleic acid-binding protein
VTVVVSDASPLIALQQIDQIDLLQALFGEVLIPPAVAREVTRGVSLHPWLKTHPLELPIAGEILDASLGAGETEAIALAHEVCAEWLLLDERAARRLAQALGLRVAGTLGLLNRAKEKGLLGEVRPHVESLVRGGFFAAPALVSRILSEAGEGEP